MRSLRKLAPSLFALLLALPAAAQNTTTTITLQHLLAHGQPVAHASVCAIPADSNGTPISVSSAGWGLLVKYNPLCANVVNGALPSGLPVPDAEHTTAATPITYNVVIQIQNANGLATGPAILLDKVPNVSGTTFALDTYTPTVSAAVPPTGIVYTTGVPATCSGPSIVIDQSAHAAYMCQNGLLVALAAASAPANVTIVNGTAFGISSGPDQVPITTAAGLAAWSNIGQCGDSTHSLSYNTTTHAFGCQTIAGGGSITANGQGCFLGLAGLVGAFTDSSGIVKQTLCIGDGSSTFFAPAGATQLLLGTNDDKYADNTGSFSIHVSVNGATATTATVLGTAMPWSSPVNPTFTFGINDGTAPVVAATGLSAGTSVTVTYVSGTVTAGPGFPAVDGNGWLTTPPGPPSAGGPSGTSIGSTGTVHPTAYMSASATSGGITALTGDVTATGPGSAAATLATVNSSPGTCGDATHVCQVTTNAKGLTTAQTPVAISGAGGGVTQIVAGTNVTISPTGGTGIVTINSSGGSGGGGGTLLFPCDILAAAGTPCIAAHSVTRKMLASYTGALFQLQRASDSTMLDVSALASGVVNTAPIAGFCAATACNFSIIYDQMNTPSSGNNLPQATTAKQAPLSWATFPNGQLPMVATSAGQFYRNRAATVNMPTGANPITEYMVVNNSKSSTCCGTYGDMEATVSDTGSGHMFALAYSTGSGGVAGTGSGPWPGMDWENGVYLYGATPTQSYLNILAKYITSGPAWALKSADATTGSLTTLFNGALPTGYSAHWEGGLSLGEGGDGTPAPTAFLEGVVIASTTTDATDNAVQSNITAFYSNPLNGVNSINGVSGAFNFSGSGVNCVGTSCAFSGGSGGSGFGGAEATFTAPVASNFTQDNFGASTALTPVAVGGTSALFLSDPGAGANTNIVRDVLVPIPTPGSPFTLTARLRNQTPLVSYVNLGLVLKNASGQYLLFSWGNGGLNQFEFFTSATTFSVAGGSSPMLNSTDMWFRWKYDGTNLIYQVSRDGNFFTTILKELLTTHLSTAPTSAGFGFNVNTSTSGISLGLECLSFTLTQP